MKPVKLEDVAVGQYKGYTDDPSVSADSLTPTFAAATLFVNNARWDGVPFFMIAGKALQSKRWVQIAALLFNNVEFKKGNHLIIRF